MATLKFFWTSVWLYRPDSLIKAFQTESSNPSVFLMCLISPYFIYLSFWQGRKGKAEHITTSAVVPGLCPPGMFNFIAKPCSYRRRRHIPLQGSRNRIFKHYSSRIYCWAHYLNDLQVLFHSPQLYQTQYMCAYSYFCSSVNQNSNFALFLLHKKSIISSIIIGREVDSSSFMNNVI